VQTYLFCTFRLICSVIYLSIICLSVSVTDFGVFFILTTVLTYYSVNSHTIVYFTHKCHTGLIILLQISDFYVDSTSVALLYCTAVYLKYWTFDTAILNTQYFCDVTVIFHCESFNTRLHVYQSMEQLEVGHMTIIHAALDNKWRQPISRSISLPFTGSSIPKNWYYEHNFAPFNV